MSHARSHYTLWVFLLTALLILGPLSLIAVWSFDAFQRAMTPELGRRSEALAMLIRDKINYALELGIPLENLQGVSPFLRGYLEANPHISSVDIMTSDGQILYQEAVDREGDNQSFKREGSLSVRETKPTRLCDIHVGAWLHDLLPSSSVPAEAKAYFSCPSGDGPAGTVTVHSDPDYAIHCIIAVVFDLVTVMIVVLLIAFELLLLMISRHVVKPLHLMKAFLQAGARGDFCRMMAPHTRDELARFAENFNHFVKVVNARYHNLLTAAEVRGEELHMRVAARMGAFNLMRSGEPLYHRGSHAIDVRVPAFLFVVAEEMTRSFFPAYVRDLVQRGDIAVASDLPVGIAISAFMLIGALTLPFAVFWSDRHGRRRTFWIGAGLATIGLAGSGIASTFVELLIWRVFSAIGYGFTFAACQGHVLDNTNDHNRSTGIAHFVSGIMVADICGPAIGGILADQIGARSTFFVAASLALLSIVLVARLMSDQRRRVTDLQPRALRFPDIVMLGSDIRFLLLVGLAAMPAKMLLSSFLFFLVPLIMMDNGATLAEVGRVVMFYGIVNLTLTPLAARLADRSGAPGFTIGLGGMIAGAGSIPLMLDSSTSFVLIAVLALGIGQALAIAPQLSLASRIAVRLLDEPERPLLFAAFRLLERIGGTAGPLLVSLLADAYGYAMAAGLMGAFAVATATLFSFGFLVLGTDPEVTDDDDLVPEDNLLSGLAQERQG